ncbi:hypothetical protein [Klebsiella phage 175002]
MIADIKHVLDNPNDVPDVPPMVMRYLQAVLSSEHITESGQLKALRAAGYSEQAIFGFILGTQYASKMLDEMEARKRMNRDEED